MNPETPETPRDALEIRITALLLGELPAGEAAELQAQIDADPELRALHRRLKRAMGLLREVLTEAEPDAAPPLQLSSAKRERLLASFKQPGTVAAPVVAAPRNDWGWAVQLGLAAALVALLGGAMLLPFLGGELGSNAVRGGSVTQEHLPATASANHSWNVPQSAATAVDFDAKEEVLFDRGAFGERHYKLAGVSDEQSSAGGQVDMNGRVGGARGSSPTAAGSDHGLASNYRVDAVSQLDRTGVQGPATREPAAQAANAPTAGPSSIAPPALDFAKDQPALAPRFGAGSAGGGAGENKAMLSKAKESLSFAMNGENAYAGGTFTAGGLLVPGAAVSGTPPLLPMPNAARKADESEVTATTAERGLQDQQNPVVGKGAKSELNNLGLLTQNPTGADTDAFGVKSRFAGQIAAAGDGANASSLSFFDKSEKAALPRDATSSSVTGLGTTMPLPGASLRPAPLPTINLASAAEETRVAGRKVAEAAKAPPAEAPLDQLKKSAAFDAKSEAKPSALAEETGRKDAAKSKSAIRSSTAQPGLIADAERPVEMRRETMLREELQSVPEQLLASRAKQAALEPQISQQQQPLLTGVPESDAPVPKHAAAAPPEAPPEVATSTNPFSTFSLNVSDVSFKVAAASLEQGQMPDPAGIRSEEFINAFDYRDPEPAPGAPLAFASERARYPFAQNRDVLRLSVKTAAAGRQPGRPLNIVLLLDNSGSMERADRVSIVREALKVLAEQLHPEDRLSIVTFARTPRLWADGVAGDKAGEVTARVGEITPQGGTNLEAALDLGYATALRHYRADGINRVVLWTDGAANLGEVDPAALKQKVVKHRQEGIALDCFGIGWEGLNDTLLEELSRNSDGRYGYLNSPEEVGENFASQLAGALRVAAADVKVQVEFNPRRVRAYRQVGYARHQLSKEQFRDNSVDAAELGAAESGNALYIVEVDPRGEGDLAAVRVRFKVPGTSDYREHEWSVPFEKNAGPLEQASPALRLAAVAGAFSELLAASPYAAEVTNDRLLTLLHGVPETYGADPRPAKLAWTIRQAKSLSGR